MRGVWGHGWRCVGGGEEETVCRGGGEFGRGGGGGVGVWVGVGRGFMGGGRLGVGLGSVGGGRCGVGLGSLAGGRCGVGLGSRRGGRGRVDFAPPCAPRRLRVVPQHTVSLVSLS